MRRKWYAGHMNDAYRITPPEGTAAYDLWGTWSLEEKIAWLWDETNRWIADFFGSHPGAPSLFLRSEELFNGDTEAITKLFSFVGSPTPPSGKIGAVLKKKLNAQTTGESVSFGPEERDRLNAVRAIAGETAHKLGYDIGYVQAESQEKRRAD